MLAPGLITLALSVDEVLASFFDELVKIGQVAHSISGGASSIPSKQSEVKQPMTPKKLKARVINPATRAGKNTNYTRSNVEAPGTDVAVNAAQKSVPPPPVRV